VPLYHSTPPSSSSPAWDNAGLITTLNNLYQQGDWVIDSGATSHMTNDEGNILFSAPLSHLHVVTVGNGTSFYMGNKTSSPIILGRPFLRTIRAIIDSKEGNVKFQFPHKKCMEYFPRKRDTPKYKFPHELHPS
jgi:hypothetical protein